MLVAIAWLIGIFIAATVVQRVCEIALYTIFLHGFQPPADEPRAADVGLVPLTALPGVADVIPQDAWPALEGAHKRLRSRLGNAGTAFGVLSVAAAYGLLALLSPRSSAAYWGLFVLPWQCFAKIGARGLRVDVLLVGPIAAPFKQLFYSSASSFGFVTVVLALALRWFTVLP